MLLGIMGSISNVGGRIHLFLLRAFLLGYNRGIDGIDDGYLLCILQAMIPRATMMGCRRFSNIGTPLTNCLRKSCII